MPARDRILHIRISGEEWDDVVAAYCDFFGTSERPARQDIEQWASACFRGELETALGDMQTREEMDE